MIPWITDAAREHGDFTVNVLDLRDGPLPLFGETLASVGDSCHPTFSVPAVKQWNEEIAEGTLPPAVFRLMAAKEGAAK